MTYARQIGDAVAELHGVDPDTCRHREVRTAPPTPIYGCPDVDQIAGGFSLWPSCSLGLQARRLRSTSVFFVSPADTAESLLDGCALLKASCLRSSETGAQ